MRQLVSPLLLACSLLFAPLASAVQFQIGHMNITTGSLSDPVQGWYPSLIQIGPNTNLVGGYIGSGGTTTTGYSDYASDNLMGFALAQIGVPASIYTAATNVGDVYSPSGSVPGGPVPYGTLDTEAGSITLDVESFFLNTADTDVSIATRTLSLDSPPATGTWDPQTGTYSLGWTFFMAGPGFGSTWHITLGGTALPVPEASTASLWLAGIGLLLPWARKRRVWNTTIGDQ